MNQHSQYSIQRSRGFTLIELLLVLGVLVTVTVFAWPRIDHLLARAEHRGAAEQVQSALWQLRSEAIQTGYPQWFRCRPGTSEYEVAALPYDEVDSIDFTGLPALASRMQGQELDLAEAPSFEIPGPYGEKRERQELEKDFVFLAPNDMQVTDGVNSGGSPEGIIVAPGGDLLPEQNAFPDGESVAPSTEFNWSKPIVFYPDGRADNARIVVRASSGHRFEITVSEMSGHVRIGPRQRPLHNLPEALETLPIEDLATGEGEWAL